MNIVGAIVAGVVGTAVLSMVMALGPRMGMPRMAIWDMLGSMFDKRGNNALGWVLHFMMGIVFAIIYAGLWTAGIGGVNLLGGVIFGAVHFLIVGVMMGAMPVMHAGIKAGAVQAPGVLMLGSGGLMGLMGGLIGHVLYGLVVALVYGAFVA